MGSLFFGLSEVNFSHCITGAKPHVTNAVGACLDSRRLPEGGVPGWHESESVIVKRLQQNPRSAMIWGFFMPNEHKSQSGSVRRNQSRQSPYKRAMPATALRFKDPSARADTGND